MYNFGFFNVVGTVEQYKEALLDYMLCGFCLQFCFPSESLIFASNTGLYTPMSPGYPPNDLLFTPILSYGFVPFIAVVSVPRGVGGGVKNRAQLTCLFFFIWMSAMCYTA